MTTGRQFHKIWEQQITAVTDMRCKYGDACAFDYVVGEKLMQFAEASEQHPEFARELPRFVAALRDLFSPSEMQRELLRLERQFDADEVALDAAVREDGADWLVERPEVAEARRERFATLRTLLTLDQIGTS
jgi:hypothetical protein